jgi:hypothetical protein
MRLTVPAHVTQNELICSDHTRMHPYYRKYLVRLKLAENKGIAHR